MTEKDVHEFQITEESIKDGTCRLFKTEKGNIDVCREKDKIKIFIVDETKVEKINIEKTKTHADKLKNLREFQEKHNLHDQWDCFKYLLDKAANQNENE